MVAVFQPQSPRLPRSSSRRAEPPADRHAEPDVTVRPRQPGRPGAVLELKVASPNRRTLEQALAEGLAQVEAKEYTAELRAPARAPSTCSRWPSTARPSGCARLEVEAQSSSSHSGSDAGASRSRTPLPSSSRSRNGVSRGVQSRRPLPAVQS